jgi:hypothetical protein
MNRNVQGLPRNPFRAFGRTSSMVRVGFAGEARKRCSDLLVDQVKNQWDAKPTHNARQRMPIKT